MRLLRCFFYYLFFYSTMMHAAQYIYPVACINNGETVLYIHQHTPTSLELLEWNPSTNKSQQILWSLFNPAGFQLLPNNKGFSFIDNGRLRIKLFQRRAPKAIDFDDPLFNISALYWIDEQSCYCSAQSTDNFSIFELYNDGTMHCLVEQKGKDSMYPQKINTHLFYIERSIICQSSNNFCYRIMQCVYPVDNISTNPTLIVDFHNKPIIFLTMISDNEGFVLEHESNVENDAHITSFSYHRIIKKGGNWNQESLFSFKIPMNLLQSDKQRLYESLLPLLPQVVNNKIYFVDCTNNDTYLEPYYYDMTNQTIKKMVVSDKNKKQGHYFVPMQCGKKFYCGGTYNEGQKEPLFSFLT